MRKILLVGGGTAREHIIAKKLKENPKCELYAYWVKNPWIEDLADEIREWSLSDFLAICDYAKEKNIDWAFIWPDNPIWEWLADSLLEIGIKSFAPLMSLARLESSKWFTRDLLNKYWIEGNPLYKSFEWTWEENLQAISDFLDKLWDDFVVKYDALLWWKWVKLSGEHLKDKKAWFDYALECLDWCWRVVVEEKLVWEEFSLMCFADWVSIKTMPTVQDHKRAFDWDLWPNTWWMGTYSHESWILPFAKKSDIEQARKMTIEVMNALEKECWSKYKWIMYWGFIITKSWVKLIEFNARFWDPEVMNLLALLKTDLLSICEAVLEERLWDLNIDFEAKASVCKYLVPEGYPENPSKWEKISFDFDPFENEDLWVYYWSVSRSETWDLIMWTSRAMALVWKASSIEKAAYLVDQYILKFSWKIFYRKDIWSKELVQKRIDHMYNIRGE